jgi:NADPH:quinone reductase
MPCSVNLNFFASFMLGTLDFPLSDIPMQSIVDRVSDSTYKARPVQVLNFEDIARAHALMELNLA